MISKEFENEPAHPDFFALKCIKVLTILQNDAKWSNEKMPNCSNNQRLIKKMVFLAENYQLHYLRTKESLEVDFAIVKEGEIETIIEVKNSNHDISKSLYKFGQQYQFPAIQLVNHLKHERKVDNVKIIKLENYLEELYL